MLNNDLVLYYFFGNIRNCIRKPNIHLCMHIFNNLSILHSSVDPPIHSFIHPSNLDPHILYTHIVPPPSVYTNIVSSIHASIHPYIHKSNYPFIYLVIHPSTHPYIYIILISSHGFIQSSHSSIKFSRMLKYTHMYSS